MCLLRGWDVSIQFTLISVCNGRRTVTRGISQPVTTEAQTGSQVNPREICGYQVTLGQASLRWLQFYSSRIISPIIPHPYLCLKTTITTKNGRNLRRFKKRIFFFFSDIRAAANRKFLSRFWICGTVALYVVINVSEQAAAYYHDDCDFQSTRHHIPEERNPNTRSSYTKLCLTAGKSPSSDAESRSTIREIPSLLWTPNFHERIQKARMRPPRAMNMHHSLAESPF